MRTGVVLALVLFAGVAAAGAAQAAVGTQDPSYADPGAGTVPVIHQPTAPSGEKPQSKLWFNDGIWWGSIWSTTTKSFEIKRFDPIANGWVDTGVAIDTRDKSIADMLWDGSHLYALSAIRQSGASTNTTVRLYRFTYHPGTTSYTPDGGFPVTLFTPLTTSDLEVATLDEDSTGELWATFTYANSPGSCVTPSTCPAGRSVLITHTVGGDDASWSAATALPVAHADTVSGDDISTIVHFGTSIGVLFSDQTPDGNGVTADYFAVHADGTPEDQWKEETAMSGVLMADDHLNMKAAPDGRVYVAAKTSRNDALVPNAADPIVVLLERTTDGVWHQTTFDTVASADTRSQVVLDPSQGVIYQFATYPPSGNYETGGWIYCKAASLDSPVFTAGRGTPFIQLLPSDDHLNNFSSTKQDVGASTGLLGIATDDSAGRQYYAHNLLDLSVSGSCGGVPAVVPPPPPPPPPPDTTTTPTTPTPTTTTTTSTTPVVIKPSTPAGTSAVSIANQTSTPPAVSTPETTVTTASACVVTSSNVQLRSLASSLSGLKRSAVVRVRVHATCALRLTMVATLKGVSGERVASAAVALTRGQTRVVSIHLTPAGRKLLAARRVARLLLTTRTPAVRGVAPARRWTTTLVLAS